MNRLGRIAFGVALVVALSVSTKTAQAQMFGYGGFPYAYGAPMYGGWGGGYPVMGYGGMGYGGLGYGGFGYGGLGYGGLGYGGYGYGGFGRFGGLGFGGYGYPAYGFGYGYGLPAFGYGYGYGGLGAYRYINGGLGFPPIPPGLFNPLFGVGTTPLAVQSLLTERSMFGGGQLIDRSAPTANTTSGSNVRQFDYYRSR